MYSVVINLQVAYEDLFLDYRIWLSYKKMLHYNQLMIGMSDLQDSLVYTSKLECLIKFILNKYSVSFILFYSLIFFVVNYNCCTLVPFHPFQDQFIGLMR